MTRSSNLPSFTGHTTFWFFTGRRCCQFYGHQIQGKSCFTAECKWNSIPALKINFRFDSLTVLNYRDSTLQLQDHLAQSTWRRDFHGLLCAAWKVYWSVEHNIITLCIKQLIKCFTYSCNISQFPNLCLKISCYLLSLILKIKTKLNIYELTLSLGWTIFAQVTQIVFDRKF